MKYPSNIDVLLIIRHSLHMYAPDVSDINFNSFSSQDSKPFEMTIFLWFVSKKYERPPNTFTVQSKHQYSSGDVGHGSVKSSTLPRNIHSKNSMNSNSHQKRLNDDSSRNHNRAYDANKLGHSPSKTESFRDHVNTLQNSTTKATMRVVNPPQLNKEPGIIDGYLENVGFF